MILPTPMARRALARNAVPAAPVVRPPEIATIMFEAADGFPLRGTLYSRPGASGPMVLISSATAVRRDFYGAFAQALLDAGAAVVLTYDFRGVGGSARPPAWQGRINMKDWGHRDMAAAAELLMRLHPGRKLLGVGQSIGGTMLGLCPQALRFERFAMVASANGYLRLTDEALRLYLAMNFVGAPLTRIVGEAPGWLGIGETLPGSVFRDWARWCRRPGFLFDDPALADIARFERIGIPILAVSATDDPWSTERATRSLVGHFSGASWSQLRFSPENAGTDHIGHLGFFKERFAASLWPPVISWLLADQP